MTENGDSLNLSVCINLCYFIHRLSLCKKLEGEKELVIHNENHQSHFNSLVWIFNNECDSY